MKGNSEGTPRRTNEYWSLRTKKTSWGNGSGASAMSSRFATRATVESSVECSAPNGTISRRGYRMASPSRLTFATMSSIGTVGCSAK